MALEVSGKVLQLLAEQTGQGKNGTWVRRDFVIETTEQYPKKICFSGWGDKAAIVNNLQPGQTVKVSFNPESREFNGKWYTALRAWKIETNSAGNNQTSQKDEVPDYINQAPDVFLSSGEEKDDLPF
jgi:hypothetical protein